MSTGVVGFGQEFQHCISFCFLQVMYFFTLLCWINKTRWHFCNERVQSSPSCQAGLGAHCMGRQHAQHVPCSPWLSFWVLLPGAAVTTWNLTAPAPGLWQIQLGCLNSQGDGLAAGSRQLTNSAKSPSQAATGSRVSVRQTLVCALSYTSSFPKGLFWVLVKWLSRLSCVIAYEMATISAINILQ